MVVEKTLDVRSTSCLAQYDIQRCFDSLDVLSIVRYLAQQGLAIARLAAVLRLQCLTCVTLACLETTSTIACRGVGTLTGSRCGFALSRIIWVELCLALGDFLRDNLWSMHGKVFPMLIWVDNCYLAAVTAAKALSIACAVEAYLLRRWGLRIKPTSKLAMQVRGAADEQPDVPGWSFGSTFDCLGFRIADDNSLIREVQLIKEMGWLAIWRNVRHKRAVFLPQHSKIRMVQRCIQPILDYRISRWPVGKHVLEQIDSVQRQFLTQCVSCAPQPCEDIATFVRRRGRLAAALQRQLGTWSNRACQRTSNWDAHVRRDSSHPAFHLLQWHDDSWLRAQRVALLPRDSFANACGAAGRTGTRSHSSQVQQRWESGILFAKHRLDA